MNYDTSAFVTARIALLLLGSSEGQFPGQSVINAKLASI